MAKRVKFPLDMGNEIMVRDIDELKANYNAEKVTEYFLNGKLLTWLEDRYYDEEAAQVKALADSSGNDPAVGLGRIFGIEISGDIDVEMLKIRNERLAKLREITSDDEIISNVDLVAFDQEELSDLLDEEKKTIYLCGDKFRLPISVKNIRYIGVNSPIITISGNEEIDLEEIGITIEKCIFSEDTQARLTKQNVDQAQTARKQSGNSSESVWYDMIPCTNEKYFTFENKNNKLYLTGYTGGEQIIRIPDGVNVIKENAFAKKEVVLVILPDTVTEIEDNAFANSKLEKIIIPDSVASIGMYAFEQTKIKNIKLPYGLTKISEGLFEKSQLKKIIIPDTVTEIGNRAFLDCPLESIDIPYTVTKIGSRAFAGTKIKNIELPYGLTKISEGLFEGSELENINIPETVTEIEKGAFIDCKLININLPNNIKNIERGVFGSGKKIFYRGNVYNAKNIYDAIKENQQ